MLSQIDTEDFFSLPEEEEIVADYVGDMGRQFQKALVRLKDEERLTQQQIADRLGVNRSVVNRYFSGYSNLTAETQAKLAWALGARASFTLLFDEEDDDPKSNYFVGWKINETSASPKNGNQVHLSPTTTTKIGSAGTTTVTGIEILKTFEISK